MGILSNSCNNLQSHCVCPSVKYICTKIELSSFVFSKPFIIIIPYGLIIPHQTSKVHILLHYWQMFVNFSQILFPFNYISRFFQALYLYLPPVFFSTKHTLLSLTQKQTAPELNSDAVLNQIISVLFNEAYLFALRFFSTASMQIVHAASPVILTTVRPMSRIRSIPATSAIPSTGRPTL